ncbi:gas vesicle protein GvpN [Virgibacillus indicus]|uniref:Gas vesicle protein GvpN n=1 Tax=Virgibacillus indicus TaxID=2024554 RepID=A0A265N9B5_9BACI|nr:gas vesicle protein GvpN [Virgibacillus indicus]OZU88405.1 gas vesicle protein GvpN [Virgibacillus indicus]
MAQSSAKMQIDNTLYEKSPYYKGLISRSLKYLETGFPIHFTGPSGIGKTTLALHIAKQRKKPVILIHGNKELSNQELIGAFSGYKRSKLKDNYVRTVYKLEENVTESWSDGRLLEAVKTGCTLVYDEFTRSRPETNNIFLSILEERILPLYGTKQKKPFEKVHPDFAVIFTSNPLEYAGVYESQDALMDRMVTLPLEHMDKNSEVAAVISKTGIQKEQAEAIVDLITNLRSLCTGKQTVNGLGLRSSIMIAEMAKRYEIPIDGTNEVFVQLCFDIAWFPLKACMDKSDDRLKKQLKMECKKVKAG